MRSVYKTPSGPVYTLYESMLAQPHLLIAGATGSGKSTVVNGLIATALYRHPGEVGFILIDPKRVELREYVDLPHVLRYSNDFKTIPAALQSALDLVNIRLKDMERRRLRMYDGSDVYLIIDELLPIMTHADLKRACLPVLQELLAVARCARVHCVACTQSPIVQVVPSAVKCNFDARVALRTATAQDSRNILGAMPGRVSCDRFPDPAAEGRAWAYYRHGATTDLYDVPRVPDEERARLIAHWTGNRAFCA